MKIEEDRGRSRDMEEVKDDIAEVPVGLRDHKGKFLKGSSGFKGGRFGPGVALLKEMATNALPELFHQAMDMIRDPNTKTSDRVAMIIHLFDRAAGKAISVVDIKDTSNQSGLPQMSMEQVNRMILGLSNVIEEANKGTTVEGSVESE